MSGAEVIGLISGIVAIIDGAIKVYQAAADVTGLPASFREVAARLPLINDTLQKAEAGMREDEEDSPAAVRQASCNALTKVLQACKDKAQTMEAIFIAVIPPAGSSRAERYLKALKTIPKADNVERLMAGILADIQVLTGNHAIRAATRAQVQELLEAVEKLKVETVTLEGGYMVAIQNTGLGKQIVYAGGDGDQILNLGDGQQINGPMSGTFYFA